MIVNITGFSYSGKGGVKFFLNQHPDVFSQPAGKEFELLRLKDGLIDLKYALIDTWSPIRVDLAIKSFRNLFSILCSFPTSLTRPSSLFLCTGQNYNVDFPGLLDALDNFLGEICTVGYASNWPFSNYYAGICESFLIKLRSFFGFKNSSIIYYSCITESQFNNSVCNLFDFIDKSNSQLITLLDNALDPSLATCNFNFCLNNIIVDRDPRIIFLELVHNGLLNAENDKDLDLFIKNYIFSRRFLSESLPESVLLINYDIFLNDYRSYISIICDFLKIDEAPLLNDFFMNMAIEKSEKFQNYLSFSYPSFQSQLYKIESQLSNFLVYK